MKSMDLITFSVHGDNEGSPMNEEVVRYMDRSLSERDVNR